MSDLGRDGASQINREQAVLHMQERAILSPEFIASTGLPTVDDIMDQMRATRLYQESVSPPPWLVRCWRWLKTFPLPWPLHRPLAIRRAKNSLAARSQAS